MEGTVVPAAERVSEHSPARVRVLLAVAALILAGGVWTVASSPGDAGAGGDLAVADTTIGPRNAGHARPARGRDPGAPAAQAGDPAAERPPAPAEPPPLEDFGAVEVQRPAVRLDGVTAEDPLPAVLGHPDVRFATVVRAATTVVTGADGQPHEVRVAAVDPRGFRVLVPQVTADAQGVWQHLVDGAAVLEHQAAQRLGAELGGQLGLVDDQPPARLGAFAALGEPAPADLLVSTASAAPALLDGPVSVLVSISAGSRPSRVAAELAELLDAEATPLVEDRVIELGVTRVGANQWDGVWDLLAWCESSGRWHLDSGNGYYGGLQFLPESWWWVGGSGMPHEASREEQIARAKILLAYQGWEAWPACSLRLGFR